MLQSAAENVKSGNNQGVGAAREGQKEALECGAETRKKPKEGKLEENGV